MQTQITLVKETSVSNSKDIVSLMQTRLEKQLFEDVTTRLEEQISIVRDATEDNFRTLLATDNYIEKYLPFRLQAMISDSMFSIFPRQKALESKYPDDLTTEERIDLKKHALYSKHDQNVYKVMHSVVLQDDGMPTLKKSAYNMPGYRKVTQE
jgi:hypothetical protein